MRVRARCADCSIPIHHSAYRCVACYLKERGCRRIQRRVTPDTLRVPSDSELALIRRAIPSKLGIAGALAVIEGWQRDGA